MASQVEIMNRAIVLMGETRISSPTQDSKAARELLAVWDTTRKALLRSHRWGYAMKRAQLAALGTPPLYQFAYQYLLPSDFIRLDFVGDYFVGASFTDYRTTDESLYGLAYTASGTVIEANLPAPLNVRYVADVTDTTKYDALFTEALAAKLAVDTVRSITDRGSAMDDASRAFGLAISAAMAVGAIERPPVNLPDTEWVLARA